MTSDCHHARNLAGSWEAANKQLSAIMHRTTGSKAGIHEEIMPMLRKYEQLRNQVCCGTDQILPVP